MSNTRITDRAYLVIRRVPTLSCSEADKIKNILFSSSPPWDDIPISKFVRAVEEDKW